MIEVSTNAGSTWTLIGDQISGTSFSWTVGKDSQNNPIASMLNNSNLRLKVYCLSNTAVNDQSANFSLAAASISVTTPPAQVVGQSYNITWITNNAVCTNYTVELSTNGGGTPWTVLKTNQAASPFTWNVPNDQNGNSISAAIGSTSNRIKVYCTGYDVINGTSSSFGVSNPVPSISVTQPTLNHGFPKIQANGTAGLLPIRWSTQNWTGNINIELLRAADNSFVMGLPSQMNDGVFDWQIDNDVPTGEYKLLLYPSGTTGNGRNSENFKIFNYPTPASPANNVTLSQTSGINFTWTKNNPNGLATYDFRIRNATTNQLLIDYTNVGDVASYTPNLTYVPGNEYTWVVRSKAGTNSAVSEDAPRSFSVAPSVAVSSPAANATYPTLTSLPIAWVFSGYTGNVSIELTQGATGTTTYTVIADNIANDNAEPWLIPANIPAGQYRVKVYNTGAGQNGNPTIVNYSGAFTITPNADCPSCFTSGLTVSQFVRTGQEGFCAAQFLCSKYVLDANNATPPTNTILRQDVAKIALLAGLPYDQTLTVRNGGGSFPADYFPTTFVDLFQGSTGSYHRYAKLLSYFQASDAATPFNRYGPDGVTPRLLFNPTDTISRTDLLKVFLETWSIDESNANSVTLPYTDVSGVDPVSILYIKKAFQLGLISNQTTFRPTVGATREEAFLILYRLRTLAGQTLPDFTANSNYYQPVNQSIGNLSVYKGLTQGNFSHHTSTDFGINDIGFSLNFAHSYQSFMTMLPDEWKVVQPLGYGWTHPYNAYMFTTVQINDAGGQVAAKPLLVAAWGDGTFEVYDNTNANAPTPISLGTNYNVLTRLSATSYTIKTKSQHIYTFTQQGTEAGLCRLTSITDRYNNTLTIAYKAGAVVQFSPVRQVIDYVQAPSGRRINFTYNTQNRITTVNFPGTSGNSRNLTFGYTSNTLTSFKDAKGQSTGNTTTYTYGIDTEKYMLKQIAFPKGNKIENIYDPNGRLQWTQARDASNNITAKTDLTGGYGTYNPNGSFRNTWTQNCSCPNAQSEATYDRNGITTEFQNKVVKVLSPVSANHPSMPGSVSYQPKNTTNGTQTYTPTYDANGNVLSITRPDSKTETFTYDTYNNRLTHTDAKAITTTYNWSADGKFLYSILRPIGNGSNLTQSFGYLTTGLMNTATNNENISTNFGYDTRGNLISIQIPVLNISSSATYDFASRMVSNTNARGKVTTYVFDDNDNLTRETDPLNRQTNYDYDPNDNLITITNAKGEVTTLGYDGFDRPISETFAGKTKTYVYDNSQNRLVEFRKAGYANDNAKRFTYTYDASNRLFANGYISEIGYDDLNRMSGIKGGTQATHSLSNFGYDVLNRFTGYTDQWNNTVGYAYDDNGNETRIDYPNGHKLHKTYDNLNRLKTLTWNSTLVATYNYVGSRLDNVVYGNGVRTQYSYDNAGRPTGISTKTNNGAGSTVYAVSFVLDNLGNHTEETETQPFGSIAAPTAGTVTNTIGAGNRLTNASFSTGSTSSATPFGYDDDGNLTNKGGFGGSTYAYDLEDNLTAYSNGTLNFSALYDAFGNRRSVTRNGTETRYVLNINGLASVLAETNSSNTVRHYYLHGLGLVARVKPDGTTIQYYHGDFRGSTIALTDAAQAITHKYQYDEFGNLLNSYEADPNPFRYVGTYGIMHESNDLTYMRARYYDPTTGRFNSEDPIWSTNLYPYAGNNGVMNIDPTGEYYQLLIKVGFVINSMDLAIQYMEASAYSTQMMYYGYISSNTQSNLYYNFYKNLAYRAGDEATYSAGKFLIFDRYLSAASLGRVATHIIGKSGIGLLKMSTKEGRFIKEAVGTAIQEEVLVPVLDQIAVATSRIINGSKNNYHKGEYGINGTEVCIPSTTNRFGSCYTNALNSRPTSMKNSGSILSR